MKKLVIPRVRGNGNAPLSPNDGAFALSRLLAGDPAPLAAMIGSVEPAGLAVEWASAAACWRDYAPSRRAFGTLLKRLAVPTSGRGKALVVQRKALDEALARDAVVNRTRPVGDEADAEATMRAALGLSRGGGQR